MRVCLPSLVDISDVLHAPVQEAVAYIHQGKHADAAARITALLQYIQINHLTHADMHALYNNRAACWLALGAPMHASTDAEAAIQLLTAKPTP